MSLALRVPVLFFGFVGLLLPQDASRLSVADLLRLVNGSDPVARLGATGELFRRGPPILPALEAAGAKMMRTITPPRGDVIYTLLRGIHTAGASSRTFGIHIEASVSREGVQQMGARHGFRLEPSDRFDSNASPACYLRLSADKDLASVLKDILLTEASVRTVNLNYIEH